MRPAPPAASNLGWPVMRGTVVGALGFLALAVLPVRDGPLRMWDALLFTVVALGFATAVAMAALRERRAGSRPDPTAAHGARIEHVLAIVLWAIAFFAYVYVRIATVPGEFYGLVTRLDAVYFTTTTLTTVGYGDIHATGQTARLVVVIQMVFNVVVIAAGVRVLLGAIRRRSDDPEVP